VRSILLGEVMDDRDQGRGLVAHRGGSFGAFCGPLGPSGATSFPYDFVHLKGHSGENDVSCDAPGTAHRNHCPHCLWSRHLDDSPGDRAADCGASMEPIAVSVRGGGEWVLVHRCTACEELHLNRTAGDDNPLALLRVATRPLALPPFPLEALAAL
jgi:RNHCP domain